MKKKEVTKSNIQPPPEASSYIKWQDASTNNKILIVEEMMQLVFSREIIEAGCTEHYNLRRVSRGFLKVFFFFIADKN